MEGKEGACCQKPNWLVGTVEIINSSHYSFYNARLLQRQDGYLEPWQNQELQALNHENCAVLFSGSYASL